jgi:type VII secretion protein EccE
VTSVTAPRGRAAVVNQPQPGLAERGLRRAPGRPGEFGTVQLVAIELAVVVVGLSLLSGSPVLIGVAAVVAILALVTALSRAGGWWGYQIVSLGLALRRRQRERRSVASRRSEAGAVQLVSPRLEVYGYDDRGSQLGVGQDEDGWFAAIAVGVADEVLGQLGQALRLERLIRLLDEGTARPSTVQFVSLRVPAPSSLLGGRTPAIESYLDLARRVTGGHPGPAEHLTWIAVRLTPADAIEAAVDRGGGTDGVHRALAAVVGRVSKILGTAGVNFRVLDAAGLTEALEVSCGLDHVMEPGAVRSATVADEQWRAWRAVGLQHAAFEVERWPDRFDPSLLNVLTSAPAERLVVAVTVRPRGPEFGLRTVVRVMAVPDRLGLAVRTVREHATSLGIRLRPMHGLHGPAVYASAPTGGGAL